MDEIRNYVIAVSAMAVMCGMINVMFDKKDTVGSVVRLIAGILMCLSVISPLVKLPFDTIFDITDDYQISAELASAQGQDLARQSLRNGIIQRTQTYILDKAKSFGMEVKVEVTVSEDSIPVPKGVRLIGRFSPLERMRMTKILDEELGISPKEQIWIGAS